MTFLEYLFLSWRLTSRIPTALETPPSDNETYQLLRHHEIAQRSGHPEQRLLERLDTSPRRIILHDLSLPLVIGGETKPAELSQVLLEDNGRIFMINQSDIGDGTDPEPQLIASVVAAFQQNKILRASYMPRLEVSISPAVALYGTLLVFYRIAVTAILSEASLPVLTPAVRRQLSDTRHASLLVFTSEKA